MQEKPIAVMSDIVVYSFILIVFYWKMIWEYRALKITEQLAKK